MFTVCVILTVHLLFHKAENWFILYFPEGREVVHIPSTYNNVSCSVNIWEIEERMNELILYPIKCVGSKRTHTAIEKKAELINNHSDLAR